MRLLAAVVSGVLLKRPIEIAATEDEHVVKNSVAHSCHPAFCVGICSWRSHRCPDHSNGFEAGHLVETGSESGVRIPNEELDRSIAAVLQLTNQVASHLGHEGTARKVGDTEDGHPPSTVR